MNRGASVTILVSEEYDRPKLIDQANIPARCRKPVIERTSMSHICVHTYPAIRRAMHLSRRHRSVNLRGDFTAKSAQLPDPPARGPILSPSITTACAALQRVSRSKHFIDHEINSIQILCRKI